MSDKLTVSVLSGNNHSVHWAVLWSGECNFDVSSVVEKRESAQWVADMLTKAIAKHDKTVNAELIAQRDRLVEVCKKGRSALADLLIPGECPGQREYQGASAAHRKICAALAESEKSDA